ncbi:NYN domain-containing protein [Ruegeria lacuscaerulensis]|uniref:NYN domain-containing protein n=1 Tax=Ruegeria lacuscaerulensis TaxID=55218 RepID=UPI00147E948A|nr:hypothetical protein [Ruegeria lacuscaerulensis]
MRLLITCFLLSTIAALYAALDPAASDWVLLAAPCAFGSAILILWGGLKRLRTPRKWAVVDGSNVMHWKDGEPSLETVRDVVEKLSQAGYTPGVVFDANVGYKVSDRYLDHRVLARRLSLPKDRVLVAPSGTPADPLVLQAATDYRGFVVSNDRFRDWSEDFSQILQPEHTIRGGFKNEKLWLSL